MLRWWFCICMWGESLMCWCYQHTSPLLRELSKCQNYAAHWTCQDHIAQVKRSAMCAFALKEGDAVAHATLSWAHRGRLLVHFSGASLFADCLISICHFRFRPMLMTLLSWPEVFLRELWKTWLLLFALILPGGHPKLRYKLVSLHCFVSSFETALTWSMVDLNVRYQDAHIHFQCYVWILGVFWYWTILPWPPPLVTWKIELVTAKLAGFFLHPFFGSTVRIVCFLSQFSSSYCTSLSCLAASVSLGVCPGASFVHLMHSR